MKVLTNSPCSRGIIIFIINITEKIFLAIKKLETCIRNKNYIEIIVDPRVAVPNLSCRF